MFIDFAFVVFAFFLTIPAVTGYFAYSYGRSFWLWFFAGCFLPVLSNILLLILTRNYNKTRKYPSFLTQYEDEQMERLIDGVIGNTDIEKINENSK